MSDRFTYDHEKWAGSATYQDMVAAMDRFAQDLDAALPRDRFLQVAREAAATLPAISCDCCPDYTPALPVAVTRVTASGEVDAEYRCPTSGKQWKVSWADALPASRSS